MASSSSSPAAAGAGSAASFSYAPPTSHILHPGYSHKVLQTWSSEHAATIPKASLVWPLFLLEDVSAH